jgi:hypothetical protein
MRRFLFIAVTLVISIQTLAETYKCKQPDGKIGYQDKPCQGAASGSQITVKITPPSASEEEIQKLQAAAAREREMAAQRQRIEEKENAEDARNQQVEARERQLLCKKAQEALGTLKLRVPLYTLDEKGNKQYVSDAARQEERVAVERAVKENCN